MPYFGFSWNRGSLAYFSFLQRVNDTRLANVGISDEANADVLLVSMKDVKLPEEIDECSFSKRIGYAGFVGDGRVAFTEILDPFGDDPDGYEIGLVDQQYHMLMWTVFLDVLFEGERTSAHRIS